MVKSIVFKLEYKDAIFYDGAISPPDFGVSSVERWRIHAGLKGLRVEKLISCPKDSFGEKLKGWKLDVGHLGFGAGVAASLPDL
jgi:hypothetical protein